MGSTSKAQRYKIKNKLDWVSANSPEKENFSRLRPYIKSNAINSIRPTDC